MAEIANVGDLKVDANQGDGYATVRQADAGEIVVSPEEAVRLGMALRAWGETALEAGE